MEIVWRSYYATNLEEFLVPLEKENIKYFVFRKFDFSKEFYKKAKYDKPFNRLIRRLIKTPLEETFYMKMNLGSSNEPYVVYSDNQSVVIDIKKLRVYSATK